MKTREEKLSDGQFYDGFTFKGKHHKPLTAAALKFLSRIKSPLYTNDFEGKSDVDIILDYLFATSATPQELRNAIDNWDIVQFEFASDYTMNDLTDPIILESIKRDLGNQNAAVFDTVSEDGGKKPQETVPIGS